MNTENSSSDTEIVVVSDTVRQRRARTPSSNTDSSDIKEYPVMNNANSNVLPDLLPKTFHLAESSSLFSQIENNVPTVLPEKQQQREHSFTVVEGRERRTEQNQWPTPEMPKISQITLENVQYFEPEYVETVHILDYSEDTTSDASEEHSTPRAKRRDLMTPEKLSKELQVFHETEAEIRNCDKTLKVEKQRISFDENHIVIVDKEERDILGDGEKKPKALKRTHLPVPERDSFYSSDKENFDEPLIFSDDEDIFRLSLEIPEDIIDMVL